MEEITIEKTDAWFASYKAFRKNDNGRKGFGSTPEAAKEELERMTRENIY